ncbi:hypothetical protein OG21DRAFT_1514393 [Imleria badia]|nr:hypothetical protein OG21DRAFT_1514393 [Imleria badia]
MNVAHKVMNQRGTSIWLYLQKDLLGQVQVLPTQLRRPARHRYSKHQIMPHDHDHKQGSAINTNQRLEESHTDRNMSGRRSSKNPTHKSRVKIVSPRKMDRL